MGYVVQIDDTNLKRNFVGKSPKYAFGRPRRKLEDNTEMNLTEIGCNDKGMEPNLCPMVVSINVQLPRYTIKG
jgi:hypothetical protein